MQPIVQAVMRSWSIPPVATLALVLTALVYLRGAWLLRRVGYPNLPAWRVGSFLLGLFSLWFALASPLDTFGPFVLTAHMLQHMILMMVAPPMILLGEPLIPIVRGMPRFAAREFAGPFLNWPIAERLGVALTNPVVALLLMGMAMFVWHVPGPYELAVRSSSWHQVEHACFFFASVIFWWPVVQPWPSRAQWPRWAMVPYLVIADLQNTVLSAVLVFSDKILYPSYAAGPSLFGFTPKEDQAAAGATMWVVGSLVFIVPAVLIAIQCLSRVRPETARPESLTKFQLEGARLYSSGRNSLLKGSVSGHDSSRDVKPFGFVIPSGLQPAKGLLARVFSKTTAHHKALGRSSIIRNFELASFLILFAVTASVFVVLSRFSTDNDDQVLRVSQQAGPFAVAVYGPAGDISVGPATFGVLVQDLNSHEVLLDSQVDFALSTQMGGDATVQQVRAVRETENKLLFSADVDLDSPGAQVLAIQVRQAGRSGTLSLPIEVMKSESGTSLRWSYIVMLALVSILCAVYLLRHKTAGSERLVAPVT